MNISKKKCPLCDAKDIEKIFETNFIPLSGIFRNSLIKPFKKISMNFMICNKCNFLSMLLPKKNQHYEEKNRATRNQYPLFWKKHLQKFLQEINKNDLIIEIGSNDGFLLDKIKELGYKKRLGVEPSKKHARLSSSNGHEIVNSYFDADCVSLIIKNYGFPRLIICRHTLEHVQNPIDFVKLINELTNDKTKLMIEVPDSLNIIEKNCFIELWDEHYNYFTPVSFKLLLENSGFNINEMHIYNHIYSKNILAIITKKVKKIDYINKYKADTNWRPFFQKLETIKRNVANTYAKYPKPIYMIGASHPQTNYINLLNIADYIDYMIDDDDFKISKIPATLNVKIQVISTEHFINSASHGTLILSGFGYPEWSNYIKEKAVLKKLKVVSPVFVKDS